jgi:hypothetical protein
MAVWGRLWVFNVHVVLIEVHGVIIECFGHTLYPFDISHMFQTLPFQPTKLLLESLSPGKLKRTCYDNGVMSLASIFFRTPIGLAKAFANANVVASDGWERHELQGIAITETSDDPARRMLNGGLRGHVG